MKEVIDLQEWKDGKTLAVARRVPARSVEDTVKLIKWTLERLDEEMRDEQ